MAIRALVDPVNRRSGWSDDVLFFVLAGTMLGAGLLVVTMRDIIRCGLAMIVCFGALAGIYVLLGAPLVGAAQVLVYIGAISVLVLFAIMLTQTKSAPRQPRLPDPGRGRRARLRPAGPDRGGQAVLATDWGEVGEPSTRHRRAGPVLFTDYVLPFEVVSVLLLAAVIGGVFLAKRERGRGPASSASGDGLRPAAHSLDAYLVLPRSCSRSGRSGSWPGATRSAC